MQRLLDGVCGPQLRNTGDDAFRGRITVAGPEIVGVRLTQAAYAHGLALALPQKGLKWRTRQVSSAR